MNHCSCSTSFLSGLSRRAVLRGALAGLAAITLLPGGLAATGTPQGPVLLEVDGDIPDGAAQFDLAALDALPQGRFRSSTIWTEGEPEFSGPRLSALLDHLGAEPGDVMLSAANQYQILLPRAMVEADAPIIATRIDGAPFPLRERGPLWLVFPYDADRRFRTEAAYAVSVWQLVRLTVLAG